MGKFVDAEQCSHVGRNRSQLTRGTNRALFDGGSVVGSFEPQLGNQQRPHMAIKSRPFRGQILGTSHIHAGIRLARRDVSNTSYGDGRLSVYSWQRGDRSRPAWETVCIESRSKLLLSVFCLDVVQEVRFSNPERSGPWG